MPTLDTIPADTRRQVERGISVLRQGGLVAFPTDTVYGLGARADLAPAVERVYTVKKRPRSKGLPLLLFLYKARQLLAVHKYRLMRV